MSPIAIVSNSIYATEKNTREYIIASKNLFFVFLC